MGEGTIRKEGRKARGRDRQVSTLNRNWHIDEMNDISVIVTTLVDGSTFIYPMSEVTTISEWLNIVKGVEHDRLIDLMDAKSVLDRRDGHIRIQND